MNYQFLTGSTGLLGSYVLRDLLVRNRSVAVLVRPSHSESSIERIDNVLRYWETQWQRSLPRPVVFCGDISEPGLGLASSDREWIRAHCRSIIHSAASLTFQEKEEEPWKTNVEGVGNLLAFCRDVGIREFAHVSTAYVSGLRNGIVYESELDVGQEFGNDYERSKVQAEQLVRADKMLQNYTIFRPSIIVGGYLTGHTTTYHGFYTPLRLVAAMLGYADVDAVFAVDYLAALGLRGPERKNLVPVDWVSDAIISILERPHPKNTTYALVSSKPVTIVDILRVIEEAIRQFDPRARKRHSANQPTVMVQAANHCGDLLQGSTALEKMLWDQLEVYRSYWRDDPVFDDTNTKSVLTDKLCPELDDEVLLRLCKFAIDSKFMMPGAGNHANGLTGSRTTE